jgi:hypothetical protein
LKRIDLHINGTLNQSKNISGTSNTTVFYVNGLPNANYNWACVAYNYMNFSNSSETRNLVVDTTAAPAYTNFSGNTTDWDSEPDITNVCNGRAVIDNPLTDKIEWHNCVNASHANFDVNAKLEYNNVTAMFGLDQTFNSSATITIRNLAWDAAPLVYRNSELCLPPDCSNVSYNASTGIAVFNVTHFTTYVTQGNSQLEIWDESLLTARPA